MFHVSCSHQEALTSLKHMQQQALDAKKQFEKIKIKNIFKKYSGSKLSLASY